MKLIARRNIYRNGILAEIDIPGLNTPPQNAADRQIAKGTVFEIGRAERAADLTASQKELVVLLNHAGCLGDPNDPKTVKHIHDEIELDRNREEAALKTNAVASAFDTLLKLANNPAIAAQLLGKAAR